jgi:putative hydrolase of the HAD superfamily
VFDVVLFDFDGVLRHFQRGLVGPIEEAAGLSAGSIRSAAFAEDLLTQAVTGAITDEQWRALIVQRILTANPASDAVTAVREWSAGIGVIDEEMLAMIRECRVKTRVVLLSNATSRLPEDMRVLNVDREFDLIVNSSVVGAAKPDRRIFDYAVAEMNTTVERTIFVDDTSGHVDAALSVGITSFVHESNEATRSRLVALGVL